MTTKVFSKLEVKALSLNKRIRNLADANGKWITVRGRKVFIKDGQNFKDALKESFDKKPKRAKDMLASASSKDSFQYTKNKWGQIEKAPPGYRQDKNHPASAYFGYPGDKGKGAIEASATLRKSGFKRVGKSKLGDDVWGASKTKHIAISRSVKGGGHMVDVFRSSRTSASRPSFESRLGENVGRRETK